MKPTIGFLLSNEATGDHAFVISGLRIEGGHEQAARNRFKEYFCVEADAEWDQAFETDHTVITAQDE